jgi:hypothetical protein
MPHGTSWSRPGIEQTPIALSSGTVAMEADMSGEQGAFLWIALDIVCVLALAAALVYGVVRWRAARETGGDRRADAATDRLYHESEEQADREAARRHG